MGWQDFWDETYPNLRRQKKKNQNTRHNKHTTYFNNLNFESSQGRNWAPFNNYSKYIIFFSYLYVIAWSKSKRLQLRKKAQEPEIKKEVNRKSKIYIFRKLKDVTVHHFLLLAVLLIFI